MAKMSEAQQAVFEQVKAGAILTITSLGRCSGAHYQIPGQQAVTVSIATARKVKEIGDLHRIEGTNNWILGDAS